MKKVFVVIILSIWSNGEPEILQYGTSVLSESFLTRKDCEVRLEDIVEGEDLMREKGISGITKNNLVFRAYDNRNRINLEYSCLEINFKL